MTAPRATPHATPIDLRRQRNTSDGELGSRLHPGYLDAIQRLPAGRRVFRGLPFGFARATTARRWVLLDREVVVDLRAAGPVSHVVVAHFCDASRDPVAGRPADLPIGWVTPVGQPLARYTVELASGRTIAAVMRRRFEVNEGIIGWGQGAFAAVAHLTDTPLDWRGPYPAMPAGGYAEPGHAGLLGILPGSWGPAQTGVADSVPSPTGDIALWLHAIEIPGGAGNLARLRMEPLAPLDAGGGVVVAAITTFRGTVSPLVLEPRRTLRIEGRSDAAGAVALDLGQVFRERPAPPPVRPGRLRSKAIAGWGVPLATDKPGTARLVDLAMTGDATLTVGTDVVPASRLPADGARKRFGRRHHRIPSDAQSSRRGGGRRCGDRRRDAGPRPVPGGRRAIPPAARPSRRDQPRPQRGHRRGPGPRWRDLRLRPRPVPHRAAGRGRAGRGGPRVRLPPAHPIAGLRWRRRRQPRPAGPAARARRRSRRHRLDRGRLPRPLHLAHLGAPPGAGRGRGHRQPAGDAMGRPPHERRRPAGRRRRRPDRPAHGRHGQREPPEHARPHRAAGRVERRPADGECRRPGGSPGRPADWPHRRLGRCRARAGWPSPRRPFPAALRGGRRRHRLGQDRRGRDAGPHPRHRWAVHPRVVSLPQLRIPTAGRGWHRQDVGRDPARGHPDVCPPRARGADLLRDLGGRGPGGADVRVVRVVRRP